MMSLSETDSYQLDGHDADELGQYRSLSTMAVIALVLGLCSPVVFASPVMIVVPLSAIALAWLALKGIASSEGSLLGAGLARCGLALALFFIATSVARVKVRDQLLHSQVDQVAREWLTHAAENRSQEMLGMMTGKAVEKLTPAVEAGQPMPFFGGILAAALLRNDPMVKQVSQLSNIESDLQLQDVEVREVARQLQSSVVYSASSAEPEFSCALILKRFQAPDEQVLWLVDEWQLR